MNQPQTNDPVVSCIKALQTATKKEEALEQARLAHQHWWALDMTDKAYTPGQLMRQFKLRAIVLATVAAVYVWNARYEEAFALEEEFLYDPELWEEDMQQPIDIYLMQLLVQKQTDRLAHIFNENADFTNAFLAYQDVYISYLNPHYEFKSGVGNFTTLVNRVNAYSRMLTGIKLM